MAAGEWYITDAEILAVQAERAAVMAAYNRCPVEEPERRREQPREAVQVGPYAQLLTPIHPLDPQTRRERWERAAPICPGSCRGNLAWVVRRL